MVGKSHAACSAQTGSRGTGLPDEILSADVFHGTLQAGGM